jgi:hypothetical protein
VLQLEVLVGELVAVDALAASAVALGEVTTLDHELLDNTVEVGALVAEALLAGSKGTEVLSGLYGSQWLAGCPSNTGIDRLPYLGDGLAVKTKDNASHVLIAMLDVEVDLVGDLGALASSLGSLSKVDKGEGQDDQHRKKDTLNGRHD